ncbi:dTDP-4-dehydrorhamnose 3,5-epimerase [Photorhabdus luminescens]|uniref:dTDP-4-dehydrorhamnose 3,5-epimerase n=1 Tax=Photorhabdus akhurstii TaxID=171438 RepID=A0ABX8M0K6_9GAMM|nr:dTDP-4-dehydrorhamnose 3,5-epimerase [Photorhabdus akhurstii]QXF36022.1 dTDP-4-dehydrorhamnose 3,5-epimerase [Photorhabdus akhurstii]UJD77862.1 dTDP-4-dehydrorhamnose 3,5-epimerase [Photorhabdus luminescens]
MKITELKLNGCYLIEPKRFTDDRGAFVKTYHKRIFEENNLNFSFKEEFYSISAKNVIRGMHFQVPPEDHEKIVYCPKGRVLDVFLDIRSESPTFGQFMAIELNEENTFQLYLSKGIAHGFLSLEDNSIMVYKTSTVYSPEFDKGIKWNSFGFSWPISGPILSARDEQFPLFSLKLEYF